MRAREKSTAPCRAAAADHGLARAALLVAIFTAGCGGGFGGPTTGAGGGGGAGTGGFTGMPADGGGGSGGAGGAPDPCGATTTADGGSTTFDGSACSATIENHPIEGFCHLTDCMTPATYRTVPPSSGNHFQRWPNYRTYTTPIPWGNLVHALEHGAVVIVYNCPGGCPDEVARAQAFINNLPLDPLCAEPDPRRVILAPDPTLDVRWAASAWTWTLRAGCFHEEAFAAFLRDHYGQGREPTCFELNLQPAELCPG